MTEQDKQRLRFLANEQMEYANTPQMERLEEEWYAHNDLKGQRTMILFDKRGVMRELMPPLLKCEEEQARQIESELIFNTFSAKVFHDDTIVNPYFSVPYQHQFVPLGIDEIVEYSEGIGHHFVPQIEDLEDEFDKITASRVQYDSKQRVAQRIALLEDLFGDILPVKQVGGCSIYEPTQNIVHIMGMENMYLSMMDYPELFLEMMDRLANDYIRFFAGVEKNGFLLPTTTSEHLGQGMYCYTRDLPSQGDLRLADTWLFANSQESVSLSPKMYEEMIFPFYKKVNECFGLLSYGCCEPVHTIWDTCLSTLENLRKVSISAWCNEAEMGEKLAHTNTIYVRKPRANYLALGNVLEEDAVRAHIQETVQAAKNCHLEIVQRDVPTVSGDASKITRYIELIREETNR